MLAIAVFPRCLQLQLWVPCPLPARFQLGHGSHWATRRLLQCSVHNSWIAGFHRLIAKINEFRHIQVSHSAETEMTDIFSIGCPKSLYLRLSISELDCKNTGRRWFIIKCAGNMQSVIICQLSHDEKWGGNDVQPTNLRYVKQRQQPQSSCRAKKSLTKLAECRRAYHHIRMNK